VSAGIVKKGSNAQNQPFAFPKADEI